MHICYFRWYVFSFWQFTTPKISEHHINCDLKSRPKHMNIISIGFEYQNTSNSLIIIRTPEEYTQTLFIYFFFPLRFVFYLRYCFYFISRYTLQKFFVFALLYVIDECDFVGVLNVFHVEVVNTKKVSAWFLSVMC